MCFFPSPAQYNKTDFLFFPRLAGRRKRRNRAANRESLLSAKSEMAGCSSSTKDLDLGVTTYRATRSFPTFAPGPAQAGPPPQGHPVAMRYQKGPPGRSAPVCCSRRYGAVSQWRLLRRRFLVQCFKAAFSSAVFLRRRLLVQTLKEAFPSKGF